MKCPRWIRVTLLVFVAIRINWKFRGLHRDLDRLRPHHRRIIETLAKWKQDNYQPSEIELKLLDLDSLILKHKIKINTEMSKVLQTEEMALNLLLKREENG